MNILPLLDELRTIARNGLTYATNPYDRERYERLLELTSSSYGTILDLPSAEVRRQLQAELGYITPKVGADGAIFDDAGRILLGQRTDNGRWCLPCGWLDPNESPAEAVLREIQEETGLQAHIVQLVDVYTRRPSVDYGLYTMVAVLYLCEVEGGTLRASHEHHDVRYWAIEDVPNWHAQHRDLALTAQRVWQAWRDAPS